MVLQSSWLTPEMEAECSSNMSVPTYKTTRRHKPKVCNVVSTTRSSQFVVREGAGHFEHTDMYGQFILEI